MRIYVYITSYLYKSQKIASVLLNYKESDSLFSCFYTLFNNEKVFFLKIFVTDSILLLTVSRGFSGVMKLADRLQIRPDVRRYQGDGLRERHHRGRSDLRGDESLHHGTSRRMLVRQDDVER